MSLPATLSEREVLTAVRGVLDPELDESIVDLGFLTRVDVHGDEVRLELRLPTYWCAPNFSWLMAEDLRQAALGVPGVRQATVHLLDHHAGNEISAGVNSGRSFAETFGEDATAETLGPLRQLFRRKAFLARQVRLLATLPRERLDGLRIGDLPDTAHAQAYLAVRAELGLDCTPAAPVITDAAGREATDIDAHIRAARLVRVSTDGNTALCRGVFQTRYPRGSG
ncbi:iron-sulfur cluster assembly protein [Actinocrispum wychmicini]|uniref:Metal-sulfur cluster biosynthetic enzyme n=1 Tax=Actinocrispum wychmicini TaxID=1213861 RepID=A0A4R2JI67_9PSEU|nr:iron-sulfur cluster assembly protein [Actinocrispum wychmicini]TCO59593.1 metal-sulfur cluster biosynthetic enzyme [Actinocrispum wychmicini]